MQTHRQNKLVNTTRQKAKLNTLNTGCNTVKIKQEVCKTHTNANSLSTGNSGSDRDTTGEQGNEHRDKTIHGTWNTGEARKQKSKDKIRKLRRPKNINRGTRMKEKRGAREQHTET